MIPVLSRAQMRAFDQHAIRRGVPSLVLMENAGRGAADVIERELLSGRARGHFVIIVCGAGNNGGDGFVLGRHLITRGARVEVFIVAEPKTPDAKTNHDAFIAVGGAVHPVAEGLGAAIEHADLVVDAIFGTGLDREIDEPIASTVRLLRGRRVVALDVPSGIDADTGVTLGTAAEAALTVTFAHLKLGHVTGHGAGACGPVHVVDIGVPPDMKTDLTAELVVANDVRAVLAKRSLDAHKYRAGHVALFAGSAGKVGAALLAAQGALRGGAGAATIVTWPDAVSSLEARIFEVMVRSFGDDMLEGKRAVVIGPGFGTHEAAREMSNHVLATFEGPIVVDADMFSLHAGRPEDFHAAKGRAILTPHAGELARLLGTTSAEVEADRFEAAREGARRAHAVVLLKGPYTVVAAPDGQVIVTGSGSPALATAGSGDILAGLIGALAVSATPVEAAWCGAFLHGVSGSAWSKEHGDRGLLASEIAAGLPDVFASLLGEAM